MLPTERAPPDLGTEGEVVGKRILAIAIDTVGLWLLTGLLSEITVRIATVLGGLVAALGVVGYFAYFIYFEAEYGQTVGKKVAGVVVVTEDGDPISYRQAAIRSLLRIVDWLPVFYLVGIVAIYLTDREQRLGDVVADTIVLRSLEKGDRL